MYFFLNTEINNFFKGDIPEITDSMLSQVPVTIRIEETKPKGTKPPRSPKSKSNAKAKKHKRKFVNDFELEEVLKRINILFNYLRMITMMKLIPYHSFMLKIQKILTMMVLSR